MQNSPIQDTESCTVLRITSKINCIKRPFEGDKTKPGFHPNAIACVAFGWKPGFSAAFYNRATEDVLVYINVRMKNKQLQSPDYVYA